MGYSIKDFSDAPTNVRLRGVKQTLRLDGVMSAFDPTRTLGKLFTDEIMSSRLNAVRSLRAKGVGIDKIARQLHAGVTSSPPKAGRASNSSADLQSACAGNLVAHLAALRIDALCGRGLEGGGTNR